MSYQPTQEECDKHQKELIEKASWKQFIHCWRCYFNKMCWSMKRERGLKFDDVDDTFCPMVKMMEREFDVYFRDKSLD